MLARRWAETRKTRKIRKRKCRLCRWSAGQERWKLAAGRRKKMEWLAVQGSGDAWPVVAQGSAGKRKKRDWSD